MKGATAQSNKGPATLPAERPAGTAVAMQDYSGFEGAGFEGQDKSDYTIPFLAVLQGLSPQLETVENAKPGKIINTVTNELYDGLAGIAFVPCLTTHVMVEWKPRDAGGGFVAQHPMDSEVVKKAIAESKEFGVYTVDRTDEKGKPVTNELIETFYVYGLQVREDGSTSAAVIAFSSTKIKAYKRWMTTARSIQVPGPNGQRITPPLFAHRYRLKTVKEKNQHGEFYNLATGYDGADAASCRMGTDDPVFHEAARLREMVKSGQAKAAEQTAGGKSEDTPF